ncbi:MAG TPA: ClbS/DfsB family four-helix bundle protein, partial [Ktedonobacterales bacterium]
LNKIETEYRALEDLLAPLDGWQLTTPRVVGAWSIKEVLIHLTISHNQLLLILQAARQGTAPEQPAADLTEEEIGRLNEAFYQAARARPLREVWAAFKATHAQVKQMIEGLDEQALLDGDSFAWLGGIALQCFIAGGTYEHYEDHILPIRVWLAAA